MTTEVDLCNRALSTLGTRAKIQSLNEDSDEAAQCLIWYEQCRDGLLRRVDWNFARRQPALAKYVNAPPNGYNFVYLQPADALRIITLSPQFINTNPVNDYAKRLNLPRVQHEVASDGVQKLIYCNLDPVFCYYTARVTTVDLFDEGFKGALIADLAAKIAYPITQKGTVAELKSKQAQQAFNLATAADAEEADENFMDYTPDYIAARFD